MLHNALTRYANKKKNRTARECENYLIKTRKIEVYLLTNTQLRVIL
nr:MAG TPA: hypothetical protein [Caudoviricetes sp.]